MDEEISLEDTLATDMSIIAPVSVCFFILHSFFIHCGVRHRGVRHLHRQLPQTLDHFRVSELLTLSLQCVRITHTELQYRLPPHPGFSLSSLLQHSSPIWQARNPRGLFYSLPTLLQGRGLSSAYTMVAHVPLFLPSRLRTGSSFTE